MKNMPGLSIIFGVLLAVIAVGFYVATGSKAPTALIPAGFGLLLIVCGIIGLAKPALRMHAMHGSALLGLIGAGAGLGMSLPKLPDIIAEVFGQHAAVWEKLAMGVISLVFLGLCVKSFVDARRARKAQSASR
ncbi:MAG: hypothetical protein ACREKL_07285 [Chthoniobacterales bacterium]